MGGMEWNRGNGLEEGGRRGERALRGVVGRQGEGREGVGSDWERKKGREGTRGDEMRWEGDGELLGGGAEGVERGSGRGGEEGGLGLVSRREGYVLV